MKIGVVLPIGGGDGPGGGMPAWPDLLAMARATEDQGLDSGWIADHLIYRGPDGTEQGMHEAWTALSAVAAVTSRIELGPIVLCASFRNPALTAKMAATLDEISAGRLVLGVGCGWHEAEYSAFGYPFDHRVGRFEEWLEIVRRLLAGERFTFRGEYHHVDDVVLDPAPKRHVPILVAGRRPRMLDLAARWADAWNTCWFGAPDDVVRERLADLDAAHERVGRDPAAVERTVGILVRDPDQPVAEPDQRSLVGSVDDVARALEGYRDLGFGHVQVIPEPMTVRSVERLGAAVRLMRR